MNTAASPDAAPPPTSPPASRAATLPAPAALPRWLLIVLGLALFLFAYWVGTPGLSAAWIQGDEYLFIVNNDDVTGAGRPEPALVRWLTVFTHPHEDLYQPIPIFTYAIEWSLWSEADRVANMRRTDVIIHALNAVLLWLTLAALLRRLQPPPASPYLLAITWALALLWALHPTLAPTYAADMGRTHLLSATFTLLATLAYVRTLAPDNTRRAAWLWFALTALLFIAANLAKPVVGYVLIAFALEGATRSWRAAFLQPRVYIIGALCVFFAWLTLYTTQESGLIEDAEVALFGDPFTRSLLGAWLYFAHMLWPYQLATWYPPDIHTAWTYSLVWYGFAWLCFSLLIAALAASCRRWNAITLGIIWYWATLVPVIGLVGARVAAAQDRYLYLPLMGVALALGAVLHNVIRSDAAGVNRWKAGAATVGLALLALGLMPTSMHFTFDARSSIRRAERVVERHPQDPRAALMLAGAYDFTSTHDAPEHYGDDALSPAEMRERFAENLYRAVELAEASPEYFLDDADRASFHRRVAFRLLDLGDPAGSLAQAQRAADFAPNHHFTFTRLAHAYRALGQRDQALRVYEQLETVLPDNPEFRALRLTEHGNLLMLLAESPEYVGTAAARDYYLRAREKFQAALETGAAPFYAGVALARCEVLVGEGARGLEIAANVLRDQPNNIAAWEVVALYHLRSEHWERAYAAYSDLLRIDPTHYEALRGLQSVALRLDRLEEAALAWQDALRVEPNSVIFNSFFVWSAALTDEPRARAWADTLEEQDPRNRFADLARMLLAVRANDGPAALRWLREAQEAESLPLAREFEQAALSLRLLRERDELPPLADLIRAGLRGAQGQQDRGKALLAEFRKNFGANLWSEIADEIASVELETGSD